MANPQHRPALQRHVWLTTSPDHPFVTKRLCDFLWLFAILVACPDDGCHPFHSETSTRISVNFLRQRRFSEPESVDKNSGCAKDRHFREGGLGSVDVKQQGRTPHSVTSSSWKGARYNVAPCVEFQLQGRKYAQC